MSNDCTRREMMKLGAAFGGMAALGGLPRIAGAMTRREPESTLAVPSRKRVIRVAHLTDTHIQPERRAVEGVGQCLRTMQGLSDKPEMVLFGGDMIMDSFDQGAERTRALWDLWNKVVKDGCSLPVEYCIGNHDIWGWNKKQSKTTGDEAKWGKKWVMDELGMAKPYRSFDRAGWRFIVLDSVYPVPAGYIGKLDDEQFEWLDAKLGSTPKGMPVLILSHIPILTVTAMTHPKEDIVAEGHKSPIWEMMSDMPRLTKLFDKHRNVKVCLSGHMHEVDKVEFQGVTYLCDGAVCGSWWKGRQRDCDEGYALIDLYDNGTVERTYQTYGWLADKDTK